MINLIPSYTYNVEQLLTIITKRNNWLIKLRYLVFGALIVFIIFSKYIIRINYTTTQIIAIIIIAFSILIYNSLFTLITKSKLIKNTADSFNPLHFSLIQIIFDIVALSALTYYTGGVESPFSIFFVFHMILGSLILPSYVVYTIATLVVLFFFFASFLEYFNIVPHYSLDVIFTYSLYNNPNYIIVFGLTFAIMMFVSVLLTNSLARSLYTREQELKNALDELNKAELVKQKYIMAIVHEIKSPIAVVQSYLDLILQHYLGPVPSTIEEKLSRARVRTDEAIQIINDIINISKLKIQSEIKKENVNLFLLLKKIVDKRKSQCDYANISIKLYKIHNKEYIVQGDPQLLELAFSNLLSNAIKYNSSGGIIEVVVDDVARENFIMVEVCDNGIGIPDSEKEKIFTDFFRASNVKQKGYEGTGLGLSVVKQIVEHHNGEITFESPSRLADGKRRGTSFKIFLPINSE
ncbi:MAG: HAMP domain-containing histidine kinase [Ignavibacteria bacterium]|nr:HAMP domain-containing histidine kinase [Ignavibacteria bacterium]